MKICRWSVIWRNVKGELKSFETNNLEVAWHRAIVTDGQLYEQMRYNAMIRLQQRYIKLRYEGRLPKEIDYPQFIGL